MNNWPSHVTKARHLASRQNRSRLIESYKRASDWPKRTHVGHFLRLRQAGPPIQSQLSLHSDCIFIFVYLLPVFSTGRVARPSHIDPASLNLHNGTVFCFPVGISPVPELSFLPAPYRGRTRAGERRVQDNLHAHAQNAAIFSPQIGGKTIFASTGPVIRATFFFNLSCNIVAVQVETLCCAYYHLRGQLVSQQNTMLQVKRRVAKSRLEFYFLQQILVLLLVLPLKLQLVS